MSFSAEHDVCETLNTFHSILKTYCTPQPEGFEPLKNGLDCDMSMELSNNIPSFTCAASHNNNQSYPPHLYSILNKPYANQGSCTIAVGPTGDRNLTMRHKNAEISDDVQEAVGLVVREMKLFIDKSVD